MPLEDAAPADAEAAGVVPGVVFGVEDEAAPELSLFVLFCAADEGVLALGVCADEAPEPDVAEPSSPLVETAGLDVPPLVLCDSCQAHPTSNASKPTMTSNTIIRTIHRTQPRVAGAGGS